MLHYTSGTTGKPKGALHVHGSVVAQYLTSKVALDPRKDDVYWSIADPRPRRGLLQRALVRRHGPPQSEVGLIAPIHPPAPRVVRIWEKNTCPFWGARQICEMSSSGHLAKG